MKRQLLELYIHIPSYARKRIYCDFLSAPAVDLMQHTYVDQLVEEILVQSTYYKGYGVVIIFIGGGIPSILKEEEMARIMKVVYAGFVAEDGAEITIEVNLGTMNRQKLETHRARGINRISIGPQSTGDTELRALGRIHTFDDFLKMYQRVRLVDFHNASVDLMSALPGQTVASWKNTLRKVVTLKPEHISAHSLIIEEGTLFYELYHSHPELLPNEDEEQEIYYAIKKHLKEQGYERYEAPNYARPGFACRHDIGYWASVEYLGLGPGVSSYIQDFRFHNETDLETYKAIHMNQPDADERFHKETEEMSTKAQMEEFMFLGLRMSQGVSGSEFMNWFGCNMRNVYGEALRRLEGDGLTEAESPWMRLTDSGVDISNYVLSEFLLDDWMTIKDKKSQKEKPVTLHREPAFAIGV